MKDKRSWDQNKSTHTVGKGGGRGARKVSGGKVTKKVEDLQLGNTWAVKKIKTKRDQSKTLNVLLVLGGGSCRDAGDGNQGTRSQLKDISEQDEGCISCLPMHPLSYSAAQNAELLTGTILARSLLLDAHVLKVVASLHA